MTSLDFLQLLANCKGLIGNSSVGIRECGYLGVPVVNIGTRQHRRMRGNNVIDVSYGRENIGRAIQQVINTSRPAPSLVYGGGSAGKKIAGLLAQLPLQFHKTITY